MDSAEFATCPRISAQVHADRALYEGVSSES
jgi:hypothetical protein